MRVAKRDVSNRDAVAQPFRLRHLDALVSERRPADRPEGLVPHQKLVANLESLTDSQKRPPFALLRTLPVADVNRRRVEITRRQRCADARVHATAEEYHGTG